MTSKTPIVEPSRLRRILMLSPSWPAMIDALWGYEIMRTFEPSVTGSVTGEVVSG